MKCKNCGGEAQLHGNQYRCSCCGATFPAEATQETVAPAAAPKTQPAPMSAATVVDSTMHNAHTCPQCNAALKQLGADEQYIRYRCPSCGYLLAVPLGDEGNVVYLQRKSEIMSRVTMGLADWKSTKWDFIARDILDFCAKYEAAQKDIQLQMAMIACITHGFQLIDAEKYKQSKIIFKVTEKIYKAQMKELKKQANTKLYESVSDYQENRALYQKCRNHYRNTKMAWKIVFFIFKRFVSL